MALACRSVRAISPWPNESWRRWLTDAAKKHGAEPLSGRFDHPVRVHRGGPAPLLWQHGQLVNANCRSRIQASLAPLVDRDIEIGSSDTRGDGRATKSSSPESRSTSAGQFATVRLMKLDPNQDDFTRPKCHGSTIHRPSRRRHTQPRSGVDPPARQAASSSEMPH